MNWRQKTLKSSSNMKPSNMKNGYNSGADRTNHYIFTLIIHSHHNIEVVWISARPEIIYSWVSNCRLETAIYFQKICKARHSYWIPRRLLGFHLSFWKRLEIMGKNEETLLVMMKMKVLKIQMKFQTKFLDTRRTVSVDYSSLQ